MGVPAVVLVAVVVVLLVLLLLWLRALRLLLPLLAPRPGMWAPMYGGTKFFLFPRRPCPLSVLL